MAQKRKLKRIEKITQEHKNQRESKKDHKNTGGKIIQNNITQP